MLSVLLSSSPPQDGLDHLRVGSTRFYRFVRHHVASSHLGFVQSLWGDRATLQGRELFDGPHSSARRRSLIVSALQMFWQRWLVRAAVRAR